jgi:hypothetical protein
MIGPAIDVTITDRSTMQTNGVFFDIQRSLTSDAVAIDELLAPAAGT